MKATNSWITYRTRFLVKARQLTASLSFTDALGRQHSGRKGDYLVESNDGVLCIQPRQIFEDIYVPFLVGERLATETREHRIAPQQSSTARQFETLLLKENSPRRREFPALLLPPHLARKSPPPYRDRRVPVPGLRSL